jgi:hypothetical protein
MGEPLDYALTKATPDVESTIRWLVDQGASITHEHGGGHESFGNVVLVFALDHAVVAVTRDRGQWMLDVESPPLRRFDFDLIYVAMTGDERRWVRTTTRPLPTQLPEGVPWSRELPNALGWLRATPDAEDRLRRLAARRAKLIFG